MKSEGSENTESHLPKLITPTDAIILALEKAEEMESVVVVGRMKEDSRLCVVYNLTSYYERIGMLEDAKMAIWFQEREIGDNDSDQ